MAESIDANPTSATIDVVSQLEILGKDQCVERLVATPVWRLGFRRSLGVEVEPNDNTGWVIR